MGLIKYNIKTIIFKRKNILEDFNSKLCTFIILMTMIILINQP